MIKGRYQKPEGKRRRGRRILLLLIPVFLAASFWWGQNALETEVIEVEGAPSAFDGFRIALVSDVHGKEFGQDNRTLLARVAELEPNMIAITGDLVHSREQLAMIAPLAQGLAEIAPTYYVTGNHEWAAHCVNDVKRILTDCGVKVLSNEYEVLERDGEKLAILGAEDLNGVAGQKTVGELADEVRWTEGENTYQLLLSHRNNRYKTYQEAGVDLTLAGHDHGGIIRLPGTDGLIGHHGFFPAYTNGRYDLSYGQMVVSRGLGSKPPLYRLFNHPHLPLVILKAQGEGSTQP